MILLTIFVKLILFQTAKEGSESKNKFRDCLCRIFVIANNRMDVVANVMTSPMYVTYHCSVNIEVPRPSRI